MAVQAQLYQESLGLPFPLPMCGLHQDWMVNINPSISGFEPDFGFAFQDQNNSPMFFHQHQSSQNFATFDCSNNNNNTGPSSSSSSTCDSFFSMAVSQSLDAQLEFQRQEMDCILQLQNERLRSALQELRKQQLAVLLKSMESKAVSLMRQKEEHLARATNRRMELEARVRKAQLESESWQRLAKENEAMVLDLSNTLEQVRDRLAMASSNRGQDEESCCGGEKDEEVAAENPEKVACKRCNSRSSCVLFFPCRHLCSCKPCEPYLASCPVCKSVKQESMEVFWV